MDRDPMFAVWKAAMMTKDVMKKNAAGDYKGNTELFWDLAQKFTEELIRSSVVEDVFSAPRTDKTLMQKASSIPAGFVPFSGFLRAASRTYEAITKGYVDIDEQIYPTDFVYPDPLRQSMAQFFGVREAPAKLNVWGEEVRLQTSVPNEWMPYKTWRENDDPLLQALKKAKFYPGMPGRKVTLQKYEVELPDELYKQHVVYTGKLLRERMERVANLSSFKKANSKRQTQMLETIESKVRTVANQKARVEVWRNHRELLEQAKAKAKLGK